MLCYDCVCDVVVHRLFLSAFHLPGEAQKIDRLMEAFADEFFAQQEEPRQFATPDTAFVLSFR